MLKLKQLQQQQQAQQQQKINSSASSTSPPPALQTASAANKDRGRAVAEMRCQKGAFFFFLLPVSKSQI